MKIRLTITLALLYLFYKFYYVLSFFVSWIATWVVLATIAWHLAAYLKRHVVLKHLGPVSSSGKAVFITGCDTGFGHMLAIELNKLGYYVFAACLRPEEQEAKSLMTKAKYQAAMDIVKLDVTSADDLKSARDHVRKILSEKNLRFHSVVNNAGIMQANSALFESEPTVEDFEQQMAVNFYGLVKTTRTFMPMIIQDKGRVVNLTSVAGRSSIVAGSAYCASKHSAVAFTSALVLECQPLGVKVVSIEPWFYKTNLVTGTNFLLGRLPKQWAKLADENKKILGLDACKKLVKSINFFLTSNDVVEPNVQDVVNALVDAVTSREPFLVYRVYSLKRAPTIKWLLEYCPFEFQLAICEWVEKKILKAAKDVHLDIDDNRNAVH